jgi:broad specificity phosphatase PhoE
MILFLIRHAQSFNNVLEVGDYDFYMRNRLADPPITELGVRQTDRLAQHFAEYKQSEDQEGWNGDSGHRYSFTHLYCSPMLRTMQTAQPVSQAIGLQPEVWLDIHEQGGIFTGNPRSGVDFVAHSGLRRSEIAKIFPNYILPDQITEQGWWPGGHEGHEACEERAARVAEELRHMAKERPNDRIALISHGTFGNNLLKALGKISIQSACYFFHHNTGISRVDFWPDGNVGFRYINRIQHLPPLLLSA